MSIDKVNEKASVFTIIGWLMGLAYYVWFGSINASLLENIILAVGGVFGSSIIIGGGVALIFGVVTRIGTGSWSGSPHGYAWGAFIAPVIAFFSVGLTAPMLTQTI